jgi:hypothetical protein
MCVILSAAAGAAVTVAAFILAFEIKDAIKIDLKWWRKR